MQVKAEAVEEEAVEGEEVAAYRHQEVMPFVSSCPTFSSFNLLTLLVSEKCIGFALVRQFWVSDMVVCCFEGYVSVGWVQH